MNVHLNTVTQSEVADLIRTDQPIPDYLLEQLAAEWPLMDEGTTRWMPALMRPETREALATELERQAKTALNEAATLRFEVRAASTKAPTGEDRTMNTNSDIVSPIQIIGEVVTLKRRGNRWVGLCPFHDEQTPSFTVNDDGLWHCFGCAAGGDIVNFQTLAKQLARRPKDDWDINLDIGIKALADLAVMFRSRCKALGDEVLDCKLELARDLLLQAYDCVERRADDRIPF